MTAAAVIVIALLAALLLGRRISDFAGNARVLWWCWREAHRRDILGDAYATLPSRDETVTWDKPPAPGRAPLPPPGPAPGHHRGGHMVIDVWRCGCIHTWTRASGWVHDFDCLDQEPDLDQELRDLLP